MSNVKRVAFITGASRGIGRATAIRLAGPAWHIVALARTAEGLASVDDEIRDRGGTATLIPQDLRDTAALAGIGPALFNKFGRLDALILNAGVLGTLTPVAQIEMAEWQQVLAINLTGPLALLQTCDPLLRATPNARVIGLTTGRAHDPKAYWGAYAASKAGFEAMLHTYGHEVEHTGMKIHIFDPGAVRTGLRAQAYPGEDPQLLEAPEVTAEKIAAFLG